MTGHAQRLPAGALTAATALWLVAGLSMLQPLSTDLYLPALPSIATHFDASVSTIQSTLWLFIAVFGCWQLIAGPLSDRFGRYPIIIAGLTIYCSGSLLCMLAPSVHWLLAGRIVQGIGACTCLVGARGVVRDLYAPSEGARLLAGAATIMGFAPLIGPLIGAALLQVAGWRASFAALTLFSIGLTTFAIARLRETHAHPAADALSLRPMLRNYRQVMQSRAFRAYTLAAAASYAGLFAFISGSPFVMMRVLGLSATAFALSFAAMVAGYLVGTVICRAMLPRHGIQHTILAGATLQFAAGLTMALAALAGWHHALAITVPMSVFGVSHGIVQPPSQAGAVAPFPHMAGAAAALMGFSMMVAASLIGAWIGASYNNTVYPLTLTTFGCAVVSLIVAAHWVRRDGDIARHG